MVDAIRHHFGRNPGSEQRHEPKVTCLIWKFSGVILVHAFERVEMMSAIQIECVTSKSGGSNICDATRHMKAAKVKDRAAHWR